MSQIKVGDMVTIKGEGPDHQGRVSFVHPNAEGAVNITLEDGTTQAYSHLSKNPGKGWYSRNENEKVALIVEVTEAHPETKSPEKSPPEKP